MAQHFRKDTVGNSKGVGDAEAKDREQWCSALCLAGTREPWGGSCIQHENRRRERGAFCIAEPGESIRGGGGFERSYCRELSALLRGGRLRGQGDGENFAGARGGCGVHEFRTELCGGAQSGWEWQR